jgi:UDP-N-acetylglucosamine/UDP-N-acetylgalactosamine 4-epimerase
VGDRTTLNELYGMIRESLDGRAPHDIAETPEYRDFRPGDVRHSEADTSAALEAFGYQAEQRVAEGIRLACSAYVESLGATSGLAPRKK